MSHCKLRWPPCCCSLVVRRRPAVSGCSTADLRLTNADSIRFPARQSLFYQVAGLERSAHSVINISCSVGPCG